MTPVDNKPLNTITPKPTRKVVVTITESPTMEVEKPGQPKKGLGGIKKGGRK
jgi:hypothetical protein